MMNKVVVPWLLFVAATSTTSSRFSSALLSQRYPSKSSLQQVPLLSPLSSSQAASLSCPTPRSRAPDNDALDFFKRSKDEEKLGNGRSTTLFSSQASVDDIPPLSETTPDPVKNNAKASFQNAHGIETSMLSTTTHPVDKQQQQQQFPKEQQQQQQQVVSLIGPAKKLNAFQSFLTRLGMLSYIAAMCLFLPLTLVPQKLLYQLGFLTRAEKEHLALRTGQFCARWLLRMIPFCRITSFASHHPNPPESIWVCNHTSMLDVFILLAADYRLRGKTKRPIKVVYWKQLEKNPITRLLFQQAGFIPVQMSDNGNGNDNDYDKSSFKQLLKDAKQAFAEGFDIGVLPEGQLNPKPEQGLLPVFSGAFTLAKMSKRPIQMLSLHGIHDLWHPAHGMHCIGRHVQLRAYPYLFRFTHAADFVYTFTQFVGHFARTAQDLPEAQQKALLVKNWSSSSSSSSLSLPQTAS